MVTKNTRSMEEQLTEMGYTLISRGATRADASVVRCNNCGEIYHITLNAIFMRCRDGKSKFCNDCAKAIKRSNSAKAGQVTNLQALLRDNNIVAIDDWDGSWRVGNENYETVSFRNTVCGHEFSATAVHINNLVRQGITCPICKLKKGETHTHPGVSQKILKMAHLSDFPDDTLEKLMNRQWLVNQLNEAEKAADVASGLGMHLNTLTNWMQAHEITRQYV